MEAKTNKSFMNFINKFEIYLGSVFFVTMTILLSVQVISRYVFKYSITWTEELSIMLFVWMQYLGISGSVLSRKQLRIDFVVDLLPFKTKRVLLIIANLFTALFCGLIIKPMIQIIQTMMKSNAKSIMLGIPNALAYSIMPVCMVLMIIRLCQENKILMAEDSENLGSAKPTIDIAALEREYAESQFKLKSKISEVKD